MATLDRAKIPAAINSYERLAVWVIQALASVGNGEEVNVASGEPSQPIAGCQYTTTADGTYRAVLSAYLPVNQSGLNSATAKTWMATNDISTAAPHVNFDAD